MLHPNNARSFFFSNTPKSTSRFHRRDFNIHAAKDVVCNASSSPRNKSTAASDEETTPQHNKSITRLLQRYESQNLLEQQAEAIEYMEERGDLGLAGRKAQRAQRHGAHSSRSAELERKRCSMFAYSDRTGKEEPIIGYYGNGQPCWWSLWVKGGREKQVLDSLERYLPGREVESWIPQKKVKAWNPKTEKMGNKTLKYGNGGWLFIKTVMDDDLAIALRGNINVLGFRDQEVFEKVAFPLPASPDTLSTIKEWEQDLSELTEEYVRKELGLPEKQESRNFGDEINSYTNDVWQDDFNDTYDDRGERRGRGYDQREQSFDQGRSSRGRRDDSRGYGQRSAMKDGTYTKHDRGSGYSGRDGGYSSHRNNNTPYNNNNNNRRENFSNRNRYANNNSSNRGERRDDSAESGLFRSTSSSTRRDRRSDSDDDIDSGWFSGKDTDDDWYTASAPSTAGQSRSSTRSNRYGVQDAAANLQRGKEDEYSDEAILKGWYDGGFATDDDVDGGVYNGGFVSNEKKTRINAAAKRKEGGGGHLSLFDGDIGRDGELSSWMMDVDGSGGSDGAVVDNQGMWGGWVDSFVMGGDDGNRVVEQKKSGEGSRGGDGWRNGGGDRRYGGGGGGGWDEREKRSGSSANRRGDSMSGRRGNGGNYRQQQQQRERKPDDSKVDDGLSWWDDV